MRKETHCRHIGYSFRLTARFLLYAPSHRQDSTYHGLCYTSRGALAGTRNSSMGSPHEGLIRRPIAPWANALTTELRLAPHRIMFWVHCWMLENRWCSFRTSSHWAFNTVLWVRTQCLLNVLIRIILSKMHLIYLMNNKGGHFCVTT